MRFSLRTLLAFEDNLFNIEQRRQLERTLHTDEAAVSVLGRIRNVMRHPYLGVPGKIHGEEELDANIAAEYLDQQMPQEHIESFENFCFSDDKYLAEIASAHQIISNVLGEPARISRDCRYRCYQILPSIPPETEPEIKIEKTEIVQDRVIQQSTIQPSIIQEKVVPKKPPKEILRSETPYRETLQREVRELLQRETLQKETPQGYRRTTPQNFYPPQQFNPKPQNTETAISGITDERVNINLIRNTAQRPEIVKPQIPPAVNEKPAEKMQTEKIPADKKAADRNLPVVVLAAAVILLSAMCFKLYNDGKQQEHNVPDIQSADIQKQNNFQVPQLSGRGSETEMVYETETASETKIVSETEIISENSVLLNEPPKPETIPQKAEEKYTAETETPKETLPQEILPQPQIPLQDPFLPVASPAPALAAEEIKPDIKPEIKTVKTETKTDTHIAVQQAAVKNLPSVYDVSPSNTVPQTDIYSAERKRTNPAEIAFRLTAEAGSEPEPDIEKPVYQFTGTKPAEKPAENTESEFAAAQPVVSFLPQAAAENRTAEMNASAARSENRISFSASASSPQNTPVKNTVTDTIADNAATAAPQLLKQMIIPAGGNSALQDGSKGSSVPQKNVVLGRVADTGQDTVLFTAKSADAPWQIETGKIDLVAEQYLLTASPFRCTFELNGRSHSRLLSGFEIEMLGDSKLCIMPLDENGTPGIYLDYGRVIIRLKDNGKQQLPENTQQEQPKVFSLRIQTEKTEGVISLTGPKSIVFADTFAEVIEQRKTAEGGNPPQNTELPPKPASIIGLLPDPQETAAWRTLKDTSPVIVNCDTSFMLDGISNSRGFIQNHPNWLRKVLPPIEATEIAAVCRHLSEEKNGNCEAVLQSLTQESSLPIRSFGFRLWGDLGRFDVPLSALSDAKRDGTKDINAVSVNRILTSYFREVMKRDEESIQRLSESIQQVKR